MNPERGPDQNDEDEANKENQFTQLAQPPNSEEPDNDGTTEDNDESTQDNDEDSGSGVHGVPKFVFKGKYLHTTHSGIRRQLIGGYLKDAPPDTVLDEQTKKTLIQFADDNYGTAVLFGSKYASHLEELKAVEFFFCVKQKHDDSVVLEDYHYHSLAAFVQVYHTTNRAILVLNDHLTGHAERYPFQANNAKVRVMNALHYCLKKLSDSQVADLAKSERDFFWAGKVKFGNQVVKSAAIVLLTYLSWRSNGKKSIFSFSFSSGSANDDDADNDDDINDPMISPSEYAVGDDETKEEKKKEGSIGSIDSSMNVSEGSNGNNSNHNKKVNKKKKKRKDRMRGRKSSRQQPQPPGKKKPNGVMDQIKRLFDLGLRYEDIIRRSKYAHLHVSLTQHKAQWLDYGEFVNSHRDPVRVVSKAPTRTLISKYGFDQETYEAQLSRAILTDFYSPNFVHGHPTKGQYILMLHSVPTGVGKTTFIKYGLAATGQVLMELHTEKNGWFQRFESRKASCLYRDGFTVSDIKNGMNLSWFEHIGNGDDTLMPKRNLTEQPTTSGEPLVITANRDYPELFGQDETTLRILAARILSIELTETATLFPLTNFLRELHGKEPLVDPHASAPKHLFAPK